MTAAAQDKPAKAGPPTANTDDDGSRVYIHPVTGERFVSVTTALKVLNKEALVFWAAKVVAHEAMDALPSLVKASRVRPCGVRGEQRCGLCRDCAITDLKGRPAATRDAAADLGSRVHAAAEHYALHGRLPNDVDSEMRPFVEQYLRWHDAYKPTYEASEATVIYREQEYAGTLDGIVRLGWCPPKHRDLVGKPLVMDIKTGKGVYTEAGLQMAAYRHADAILLPNGTEQPVPATEDTAIVLHLRPEGYHVYPVDASAKTWAAFLGVLGVYRWEQHFSDTVIGRAMSNPRPPRQKAEVA